MSPERVPITSPSSGVSPIVVSTDRPPSTAVALQPLPRCATTRARSVERPSEEFCRLLAHVAVTGAVEAVLADAVLLIPLVRNGVAVRPRRHRLVERGVEHRHLRNVRPCLAHRA